MNYLTVKDEVTEFNLTGNHKAFCIPGDYDTNEFAYTTAPLSDIAVDMEKRIAKKSYESKAEGRPDSANPVNDEKRRWHLPEYSMKPL